MGLPVNKFIAASNKNNILTDFFTTGKYDANREFFKTNAPAMDILVSSNLERLVWYMSGKDGDKVKEYMEKLKKASMRGRLKEAQAAVAAPGRGAPHKGGLDR